MMQFHHIPVAISNGRRLHSPPTRRRASARLTAVTTLLALLTLPSCMFAPRQPPLPPPPPPVVLLAPSDGPVLAVDVFRLPEGVEWESVNSYCANGVRRAGDITVTDRRTEPKAAQEPCVRVVWLNGLPQRWEGCCCDRFRKLEICGVAAARSLVGLWNMPREIGVAVLLEVGWWDEAATLAEREWVWGWKAHRTPGGEQALRLAVEQLPSPVALRFHERLTSEALEHARNATAEGDSYQRFRAGKKLSRLGQQLPRGVSAASFLTRVHDSGVLSGRHYSSLMQDLRPALLAERAYVLALEDDTDPVGHFLDDSRASDLVTAVASLYPSALIPAPSHATSSQKFAIKEGAIMMLDEKRRKDGLLLYEALVGVGRVSDAQRLKRELLKRYPLPLRPTGDSPEDEAMRRVIDEAIGTGDAGDAWDFESRFREAEERAKMVRGAVAPAAVGDEAK